MPLKANPKSSWASVILIVILLVALLAVRTCRRTHTSATKDRTTTTSDKLENNRGLNRNPSQINYSKHARCRMDCRHISEAEVKDILENGKVNYNKSELDSAECKKRYAIEGTTSDHQKVRIVFAPCQNETTVVTVIDIGKEWPCDCPHP